MWNEANQILNQAAERIRHGVVDFLPGLLALVLVMVLTLVVAWIVRAMVRRSLRGFDFDRRAAAWGFPSLVEWSPSKSPTLLMARISFWTVVLMGALAALSALDASLTQMLAMQLFAYFPNVVAALLILIRGNVSGAFSGAQRSDQRGQHADTVGAIVESGREVAGDGDGLRDGAESSWDWRGDCPPGLRHSFRRDRAGAGPGSGAGLQGYGQPYVGAAERANRRGTERAVPSSVEQASRPTRYRSRLVGAWLGYPDAARIGRPT